MIAMRPAETNGKGISLDSAMAVVSPFEAQWEHPAANVVQFDLTLVACSAINRVTTVSACDRTIVVTLRRTALPGVRIHQTTQWTDRRDFGLHTTPQCLIPALAAWATEGPGSNVSSRISGRMQERVKLRTPLHHPHTRRAIVWPGPVAHASIVPHFHAPPALVSEHERTTYHSSLSAPARRIFLYGDQRRSVDSHSPHAANLHHKRWWPSR